VLRSTPSRHHDAADPHCMADWFVPRFDELAVAGDVSPRPSKRSLLPFSPSRGEMTCAPGG
jgi:hypothetical protein